jgi:coenzyme F420 hydrogenase subunit beta
MEAIRGMDELYRRVIEPGRCASCGACVGRCPYLTRFRGKTVKLDQCTVEHGRCFAYCPMTFFDEEAASQLVFGRPYTATDVGYYSDVRASKASDPDIAAIGQGGGTITALLLMALEADLIDSAVLTAHAPEHGDHFPRGITAATRLDILSSAGSRFVGAHSLSALREALDKGYQRIAVVGLPCQVRSLRKMALYDLKEENLKERISLVVGLFCNWSFSSREFYSYLSERFQLGTINRLDIPPPPSDVLVVESEAGTSAIPLDEVRPMIQAACHECPDLTSEFADLSVGMYEGRPGWNTLIARSVPGGEVLKKATEIGVLETEPFADDNLNHLKGAAENKRTRAAANERQERGEAAPCH